MKATKLLLVTAIFTGFTTLSFAGPGADYWARMTQAAKDNARVKTEAKAQPAAETQKDLKVCANCGCPDMKKA